jgi:hypothetical protein
MELQLYLPFQLSSLSLNFYNLFIVLNILHILELVMEGQATLTCWTLVSRL